MQVNAAGRLTDPQEFSNIVVRADPASGAVVRLRDVARVELGALQYSSSAYFGKDPTVVLAVFQMPGSNALDLQSQVKTKMEELAKRFPPGIAYAMHYDTTRFVSAAMRDVVITLIEALLLVVFVVYIFLQSWRTTIIPTIAIPVSLIATLAVMQVCGFSLNMLSLLGMVLAIGLVVDDAIVVVENVERQLEAGLPPLAAAQKAMSEVTGPIIATTAVLMAVFVPVAFIPGVAGRLYNQFALTVAISVGISAFNSLTLSPALSAALLRHEPEGQLLPVSLVQRRLRCAGARLRPRGQGVHPLRLGARRRLRAAVRRRLCAVAHAVVDVPAGRGSGLFLRRRATARRRLAGAHRRGRAAGARHLAGDARRRDRRLHQRPQFPHQRRAVEFGGRIRGAEAVGRARAGARAPRRWSPRSGRSCSAIPDAFALSFDPPSVNGLGTTGGFEFEVEDLTGHGSAALNDATQALLGGRRAQQPELNPQSLFSSFSASTPQFFYDLDRTKAKLLGLSLPDVFNTLADLSRLALRQRLQPVWPYVPRDAAGRQGFARRRFRSQQAVCPQQRRRHGAAECARAR